MTLEVTFDVWKLSNSHTLGNIARAINDMFANESDKNVRLAISTAKIKGLLKVAVASGHVHTWKWSYLGNGFTWRHYLLQTTNKKWYNKWQPCFSGCCSSSLERSAIETVISSSSLQSFRRQIKDSSFSTIVYTPDSLTAWLASLQWSL